MISAYIGHASQLSYAEEHRLVGGKGDGMRLFEVNNGRGLCLTASIDRGMDISRLQYKGVNCGYFAPCGYVAPAYFDDKDNGFLKSFSAGFLTTCGLSNAGVPCTIDGQSHAMHGTIGNTPAENAYYTVDKDRITLYGKMNSAQIFADKLSLERKIVISNFEDSFTVEDIIRNEGDRDTPIMLMYHMNIGYPLLSENAQLQISSSKVLPRDEIAAEGLDTWDRILQPTPLFKEQCYFHFFEEQNAIACIENPDVGIGLEISFNTESLNCLTEWKMMGVRDYVLGLEPGNCYPIGRAQAREEGSLVILEPMEERSYRVKVRLYSL